MNSVWGALKFFFLMILYTDEELIFRTFAAQVIGACEFSSKKFLTTCTFSSVVTVVGSRCAKIAADLPVFCKVISYSGKLMGIQAMAFS